MKPNYILPLRGICEEGSDRAIQTKQLKNVEKIACELAASYGERLGMTRREFLATGSGAAVAFIAMNAVFGDLYSVDSAEAADPEFAETRRITLSKQPVFDVQTHFVSPSYTSKTLLTLRELAKKWNPGLKGEKEDLDKVRFDNFYREVYQMSDTKIALLSSAPNDDPKKWFLHNDEIAAARERINSNAGRKIMFSHALFTPGQQGWLEEMDRAISDYKPDAWKGYTSGAPFEHSKYPWRLDDEKLTYPAYEKMMKAGIKNVCIHKGLMPSMYEIRLRDTWKYHMVDDLPKAAGDWPELNFMIYHSGLKMGKPPSDSDLKEFEKSGYIPWVSDLAAIPARYGVKNVYGELGSTFAITSISQPRYCAGILGILIKGLGADHVLWGTDSVWYGSPQWQIETFRRIEIPDDLRKKFGYSALGPADGEIRTKILSGNAQKLYKI